MSNLDIRHEGPISHVWLNRPTLRNAFDAATIAELTHTFTDGQPTQACAWWCWARTARRFALAPT
jgi:1,4-dihydroxy-2-naphthoyl-CoA synthase